MEIEEDIISDQPKPQLESSPQKKDTEEDKENAASQQNPVKPITSSWLVFDGAKLFADDEEDRASNASSISLPNLIVDEEGQNVREGEEDDAVLKLDQSSFLDEHEIGKAHNVVAMSNIREDSDDEALKQKTSKKSKKHSSKKHRKEVKSPIDVDIELPALNVSNDEMDGLEGLGDAEDEEDGGTTSEMKKSKPLSKKELQKMHSDAQRVLREAPVSVPVRKANPINLDDILLEVASVNPEVKKMLEKDEMKRKAEEEKRRLEEEKRRLAEEKRRADEEPRNEESKKIPAETAAPTSNGDMTSVPVDVDGNDLPDFYAEDPAPVPANEPIPKVDASEADKKSLVEPPKILNIPVPDHADDDDEIELEIEDEGIPQKAEPVKPVNPGVAWLMQRFKKHSLAGKKHHVGHDDQATGNIAPPSSWTEVKEQLQEEMAQLREQGLKDRIERFKMENDEEFGEQEPEEEEAEDEPGSEDDDDSYSTITDEDENDEEKNNRLKRKKARKAEKEAKKASTNMFLDREAAETGSEDEDYQPSEGHREEGAGSTDDGSIDSEEEKVRSDNEDDDEDVDEDDDDLDDDLDEGETSDEEETILRSQKKSKKLKKRGIDTKKAFESDEDDEKDDADLPDLIVEDRGVDESSHHKPQLEAVLEPSVTSVSSVVMPPDMPRPKELFNVYSDPFDFGSKGSNEEDPDTGNRGMVDSNMDDLLGLCTGPFIAVANNEDEEEPSGPSDVPHPAKPAKHVYGNKSQKNLLEDKEVFSDEDDDENEVLDEIRVKELKKMKKERKKQLREFFEDEAELSESDEEAGKVSADEDEGSSDDDSYETDSEFEDEELKKLNAAQLKNQVESIHMKQIIDEDERDLLHLREAIIPDADLADDTGKRLSRFRWADAWRDMGGTDLASQGENAHADDDYLGLGALDANGPVAGSSMWQKQRVERERFLQNQAVSESQETVAFSAESETTESSTNESKLVRLGMSAMRKSLGSSFNATISSETTVVSVNTSLNTSTSLSVPKRISHGSMLSWLHQKELDKIASNVGPANGAQKRKSTSAATAGLSAGGADPKPEDLLTVGGFKSRSSAGPFIVMSESSPSDRKRKFEMGNSAQTNAGASAGSASKRGKPTQASGSVFDFLS